MLSQKDMVLQYLNSGYTITPLEALEKFKCMRLAAIVFDLKKDGHHIITRSIKDPISSKRYASYKLIPRNIQRKKHLEY